MLLRAYLPERFLLRLGRLWNSVVPANCSWIWDLIHRKSMPQLQHNFAQNPGGRQGFDVLRCSPWWQRCRRPSHRRLRVDACEMEYIGVRRDYVGVCKGMAKKMKISMLLN